MLSCLEAENYYSTGKFDRYYLLMLGTNKMRDEQKIATSTNKYFSLTILYIFNIFVR